MIKIATASVLNTTLKNAATKESFWDISSDLSFILYAIYFLSCQCSLFGHSLVFCQGAVLSLVPLLAFHSSLRCCILMVFNVKDHSWRTRFHALMLDLCDQKNLQTSRDHPFSDIFGQGHWLPILA